MTNNLSYLQVAVWIHNHGLHADDPTVGYLEDWAKSCRTSTDPPSPMDLGMLGPRVSMLWRKQCPWSSPKLIYPSSTHPTLLALTLEAGQPLSKIAIEAKRLFYNLAQLINGVSTEEEREESPPKQESHPVQTIDVQLIF